MCGNAGLCSVQRRGAVLESDGSVSGWDHRTVIAQLTGSADAPGRECMDLSHQLNPSLFTVCPAWFLTQQPAIVMIVKQRSNAGSMVYLRKQIKVGEES